MAVGARSMLKKQQYIPTRFAGRVAFWLHFADSAQPLSRLAR